MAIRRYYAGLLNNPVGNNLKNDPDDVETLKNNFAIEGSYTKPVENGYIDYELNDAIYSYQKNNDLKMDGRVNPGGETEATLIGSLLGYTRPQKSEETETPDIRQAAALPALAYRLAMHMGMSAMAAWTWWQSQSPHQRQKTLGEMGQSESNRDPEDDKQHCENEYEVNTRRCNDTTMTKGPRAGAVCHESASHIYAACRAGKPDSQWPPLQE